MWQGVRLVRPRIWAPAMLALVALAALAPLAGAAGPGSTGGGARVEAGARALEALEGRVEILVYMLNSVNVSLAAQLNQTLARAEALASEGNETGAFQLLLGAARQAVAALQQAGMLGGQAGPGAANGSGAALEAAIEVHERHVELLLEEAMALAGEYNLGGVIEKLNQSQELLAQARAALEEGNVTGAARLLHEAVRLIGAATSEFYRTARPAVHMQGGLAGLVRAAYNALEAVNESYDAIASGSPNASQALDEAIARVDAALRLAVRLQARPHVMVTWYTEPLNTLATALQAAGQLLQQARDALEAGNDTLALELVGQARDTLASALDQVRGMAGYWPQLMASVAAGLHGGHEHGNRGPGGWCPCPGWGGGMGWHGPGRGGGHKGGGDR